MNWKYVFIGLAVILAIGLVWYRLHPRSGGSYVTTPVTRGDITSLVQDTGTINPVINVTVGAQVSGKITKLYVDFNSRVRKGELLALIDPATYQDAAAQSRADLANTSSSVLAAESNVQNVTDLMHQAQQNISTLQAQVNRDKANLANAKVTYDRDKILVQKNYIARSDADTARYTYEADLATVANDESLLRESQDKFGSSQAQLQSARDQVSAAVALRDKSKAGLSQSMTNLNYTRIISPVDGVVVARNVDVGQTVVSSFQAPSLFVIAQDLKKMQIDTQVDEASVGKLRLGQEARFNVAAFPTENFIGSVKQIRINPIIQQNVVNYDVVVAVDNSDLRLLPGMTATVNFVVAQRKNVLMFPNQALRFSPPATGTTVKKLQSSGARKKQSPHVWVLENKKPVRKDVQLGITDDSNTEVISGLNEGDQVITDIQTAKTSTVTATTNPLAGGGRRGP